MTSSLSDFEQQVCNAQIEYISLKAEGDSKYETYGELYSHVQKFANESCKYEIFKSIEFTKLQKLSKVEKIKTENTIRLIGEFFSVKRNIFSTQIPYTLLQSNNLDLKIVGFCFIFYSFLHSPETFSTKIIFSVIISAQRFLKYVITFPAISEKAIKDLEKYCKKVIVVSKFDGTTIQEKTQELITQCPFDVYIPKFPIEPYPAQKELYQFFSNPEFTKEGGIVFLSTATNSGKTFSVVGLAKKIDTLKKYVPIKLLFSCIVESVRDKINELLKFSNISYGVIREERCSTQGCQNYFVCEAHSQTNLYTIYDPTIKEEFVNTQLNRKKLELEGFTIVKKGNQNKNDSWRIAILDPTTNIITKNPTGTTNKKDFSILIAPPHLAYTYLIENERRKYETCLFLDEFTIGSTNLESKTLENHILLIKNAPKWTFLSNANFVGDHRMEPILHNHQTIFSKSKIYNITSATVYTCSTVKTYSGMNVLPHYRCKTNTIFSDKLKNILRNQFKGRMYNTRALKNMYTLAKKCIDYTFTFENEDEKEEKDVKSIKLFNDRLPDINILFNDVDNLSPDNIRKLSMEILKVIDSIEDEDDEICSIFTNCPKPPTYGAVFEIPQYDGGMSLIGTLCPKEFALSKFSLLLSKIKNKISLGKLYNDYEKAYDLWETKYDSICSKTFKDDQEKAMMITEIVDGKPTLVFPSEFQIGVGEKLRTPIQIANINFMSIKNEDMALLLFAGIGIYNENEKDKVYLQILFDLCIKGQLAFVISNVSYGIDYPFKSVYVCHDFSETKSMNEVYQLLSRGGRGLNNQATIFISDACAEKIFDVNEEGDILEVKNMMEKFNYLTK